MPKLWIILLVTVAALTMLAFGLNRPDSARALSNETDARPVAANEPRVPVLVELFTSEGCSSCPPADAALVKLERTQPVPGAEIIALGQHVDYWNYIGWSDPFSSRAFSERQERYAEAFGRDGVYTPQMVVDGEAEFIGSNLNKAREAIAKAALRQKATVQITRAETKPPNEGAIKFNVRVTDLPLSNNREAVDVLLAITESNLSSNVSRGENAGRKLEHGSVVRLLGLIAQSEAGESKPLIAAPEINLSNDWQREHLRAVVFVQARQSRRVLGATAIRLGEKN